MNPTQNSSASSNCFPVRPYSPGDLADMYKVSPKILLRWTKPFKEQIGKRIGRYYNVSQVERIFSLLGPPYREYTD